jgi:protein-tyrosine phosphatase
VKEVRYPFYDGNMADINLVELYDIVRMAHTDWKAGKKVLIRCQAGLNRSGLIMALVLIREGYKAKDAIALMREKRGISVLCNRTFEKWLLSLPTE